jgi:xanthine dehydrogenase accessory factor
VLAEVVAAQQRGEGAVIVTLIANRGDQELQPGTRMVVTDGGAIHSRIHSTLDPLLVRDARDALHDKKSRFSSYRLEGSSAVRVGVEGGDVDIFFEVLSRPPRLVIVGAGHIAVPLAKIAKLLDFEVLVLDDRPEYASRERFPDANEILVGPYRETLARVTVNADTYIVLVTRGHVHDQACLEQVIDSPAAYIGMIGSKRRVRTVATHVKERGVEVDRLERLYAPIGLDIGSQTPAEIAVAIMAEIVNVRRGGHAPSLALRERLRA